MIMMIDNIKAAVFDMDGLLLDTERICFAVLTQVFEEYGHDLSTSEYAALVGLNSREVRLRIQQKLGNGVDLEKFVETWKSRYFKQTVEESAPTKKGVIELLEYLKGINLPIAVATSTDYETAEKKLVKSGLREFFSAVIGGDQIERSKPAPDIYLKAADCLDIAPEYCLAFEDSTYGVQAALAAGMQTVHIPDMVEVPTSILKGCVGVFASCGDFLNSYYGVHQ